MGARMQGFLLGLHALHVADIPLADAARKRWTDDYLIEQLDDSPHCNVLKSGSNRFMFWHDLSKKESKAEIEDWQPPTDPFIMKFSDWLRWAKEADDLKIGPEDEHYYFTSGVPAYAKTPGATGMFIADDLPFFSTRRDNFFITNVERQKGIQCRFGARGIIAESHFDHGKNFVLMLRGRKRYLLNPPKACSVLAIIKEKSHPSFRHSNVSWADENEWPEGFADAPGLDTVLAEGEMLYIPSLWYHYIVSEGFSVQCNARSGLTERLEWITETEKCLGRAMGLKSKSRRYDNLKLKDKKHKNKKPRYRMAGSPPRELP